MRRIDALFLKHPFYGASSAPHPAHRVYPYLLKGFTIERANQVWCADITYIPVRCGCLYLVAIMDWASRLDHRDRQRAYRARCRLRGVTDTPSAGRPRSATITPPATIRGLEPKREIFLRRSNAAAVLRLVVDPESAGRDELAWYKSAVQEKARASNAGLGRELGRGE